MRSTFLKASMAPAAALFAAIAVAAMTAPASAAEFCRTDVTGHMTSCSYTSLEQCHAASAGIGGDCFRDPSLGDSNNANANAYAYHPESSRSRRAGGKTDNTSE